MPIKTYQAYAEHLKRVVEDEREACVVDKKLVLTAAAAIEELVNVVIEQEHALTEDKAIIEELQQGIAEHKLA
ncbi:hypothetical protein KXR87_09440 [Yokenella regensburgei]|uniref:hypothetical protein n=1 Tax=Yokenella regensburgei TaxID=158877 RepID=UPI003F13BF12